MITLATIAKPQTIQLIHRWRRLGFSASVTRSLRKSNILKCNTLIWAAFGHRLKTVLTNGEGAGDMSWGGEDYGAAALSIGDAGIAVLLVLRFMLRQALRLFFIGAILVAALAIWAHLSVGIF